MATMLKRISGSKYQFVALYITSKGKKRWRACVFGNGRYFDTEREAAIAIDLKLISKGKKPVNILVSK